MHNFQYLTCGVHEATSSVKFIDEKESNSVIITCENCVPKMVVLRQIMTPKEWLSAIGMIQAGSAHRKVAITLNCDHRIIDRLCDRYIQTETTIDRPRSGRPHVTSARGDQYIVNSALRQRSLNSRHLRELFRAGTNIKVSDQTILNRLHAGTLRSRHSVVCHPD